MGCTIKPQIYPQVTIKQEPRLEQKWFQTEDLPDVKPYKAEGKQINGETWTCFSPKDSKELAIELMDYRTKLKLMNKRMELLFEKYFGKEMYKE